jgi:hypothetical protein
MRSLWLKTCLALLALPLVGAGCAASDLAASEDRGNEPGSWDDDDMAGDDDDAADDDDDDEDGNCLVSGTAPVDGDPTAYYRDPVQVFFAEPVAWGDLSLSGPQGTIVGETTLADDGLTLTFDPYGDDTSLHLEPLTDYHASLDGSGCSASWSFTTSVLGTPLTDDLPADATYYVELSHGELVQPAGIETLMDLMEMPPFLLEVTAGDGDDVDLLAAPMDEMSADQDSCQVTVDITSEIAATLDGSHLSLPVTDVDIPLRQQQWDEDGEQWLTVMQLGMEAEFSPDGQSISHGRLSGMVDGFQVDAMLGLLTDDPDNYAAGSTCDLLDKLGVPCEPCPGNPEQQTCIPFVLDGAEGYWRDADGLYEVAEPNLPNCSS